MLFSIVAVPGYLLTSSEGGIPSFHTLSIIYCCTFFDDSHSDWCEMMSHCSFDLHLCTN